MSTAFCIFFEENRVFTRRAQGVQTLHLTFERPCAGFSRPRAVFVHGRSKQLHEHAVHDLHAPAGQAQEVPAPLHQAGAEAPGNRFGPDLLRAHAEIAQQIAPFGAAAIAKRQAKNQRIRSFLQGGKSDGFDALIPTGRGDLGKPRKLDHELQEQIRYLKSNYPRMSAAAIYRQLQENGSIKSGDVSEFP